MKGAGGRRRCKLEIAERAREIVEMGEDRQAVNQAAECLKYEDAVSRRPRASRRLRPTGALTIAGEDRIDHAVVRLPLSPLLGHWPRPLSSSTIVWISGC